MLSRPSISVCATAIDRVQSLNQLVVWNGEFGSVRLPAGLTDRSPIDGVTIGFRRSEYGRPLFSGFWPLRTPRWCGIIGARSATTILSACSRAFHRRIAAPSKGFLGRWGLTGSDPKIVPDFHRELPFDPASRTNAESFSLRQFSYALYAGAFSVSPSYIAKLDRGIIWSPIRDPTTFQCHQCRKDEPALGERTAHEAARKGTVRGDPKSGD